jgi:hypothetical protein
MTITISGATIAGGVVFEVAEAIANSVNFDTAGANSWTVPAGVTSAVIKLWGGGGASGGTGGQEDPGGGGGGGYASKVLTVTPAQVLSFTVGAGGPNVGFYTINPPFNFYTNGSNGTASTYSTISAGGGEGGGDGASGGGGTSSGGDVNTSGFPGQPIIGGGTVPYGGASPNGGAQQNTRSANGNAPGGGGSGGAYPSPGQGANGRVRFEWSS